MMLVKFPCAYFHVFAGNSALKFAHLLCFRALRPLAYFKRFFGFPFPQLDNDTVPDSGADAST